LYVDDAVQVLGHSGLFSVKSKAAEQPDVMNSTQPINPPLLIWGAAGHARVVADIIRLRAEYNIVGFLDNINPERRGTTFCGAPILGSVEELDHLKQQGIEHIILGFGNCTARLQLAEVVRSKGFRLVNAIHPQAIVASDVSIGAGSVIAAGAVVNPATQIGEHVIINTGACVDHDGVIADGCHISPGVRLGGHVTIDRASWIGIGATVIDHLQIGANTLIGAGSVVVNDIPDNVVAYGVPARIVRSNVAS
jgi:acetyltransferase EpsM